MNKRAATVAQWVERLQAVLKAAEADGVTWAYEADYCNDDGCTGCCRIDHPLTASRDDGFAYVQIY